MTRLEWREGSSYPSAAALGALDEPALTEEVAAAIAADLAAAGVNWNFAPVADVNVPANPVIGVRSFGSDASLVARHVAAAVRGFQRVGVAACAKHFPGHGSTVEDSHLALPALVGPIEAGLEPFRAAIAAGVASIMTAHIKVNADAATLDPAVLHDLLRSELGFEGAIVADALEMKGRERATRSSPMQRCSPSRRVPTPDRRARRRRARDACGSSRRSTSASRPSASRTPARASRRSRAFARPRDAGGRPRRGARGRRAGRPRRRATSRSPALRRSSSCAPSPTSRPVRQSTGSPRASSARASRSPTPTCTSCATFIVIRGWKPSTVPGAVVVEIGLPVWRPQRGARLCLVARRRPRIARGGREAAR